MSDDHEVFPSAPLALVAVEVRFPGATTGSGVTRMPATVQRSFRDRMGEAWVIESMRTQQLAVAFGPGGPTPSGMQSVTIPRFTVRDRTLAVAVTDESVTVETTNYRHYPEFRKTIQQAIAATADLLAPDGVARVGIRYIDEIRVSGITEEDPSAWREWIDPSLLAPRLTQMTDEGFPSRGWEGLAQYETGPDQKLVLRFGPRAGYVVNPVGTLRRPSAPRPGPLFMLDFDCFWEPQTIPEFDPKGVLEVCDQLRAPIRKLFDGLLTDRLLAEFRKEPTVA